MSFIQPVQADTTAVTGAWTWTDISDFIKTRSNRPIWAVAHIDTDTFLYTDGQDLWNGGIASRYEKFRATQFDIASDVRNAGVDRIDDMVSDGSTVLFLQNVVRTDDSIRIVAYQNGEYKLVTPYIQNVLASNEGINQIVGRNGTWYIVTTKGRLLKWTNLSTNPTVVSLPSTVTDSLDHSLDNQTYNLMHGSVNGGSMNLGIAPVTNNQWVVAAQVTNATYGIPQVLVYRFDGSNFTIISSSNADFTSLSKIVSNGNKAYIFGGAASSSGPSPRIYRSTDGYTVNAPAWTDVFNNTDMQNVNMAWNGVSWMVIVNNKHVYRFTDDNNTASVSYLGIMRDYFTTVAGDDNGHFYLGGAVSTVDNDQPTYPLTAKLVEVRENNQTTNANETAVTSNGSFGGDRVYTSSNGPRVTIQGNPSGFRIGNGKEFAYRVSASDTNGIDRIDIYVNGALIKTCNDSVCEFRNTYYTKNAATRTISFYTRATDKNGYSTDTSGTPDVLTVDTNSSATADGTVTSNTTNTQTTSGSGITSWTWFDPNTTALNSGDTASFNVGAYDANGINKVDIYVNGNIVKTCNLYNATGNQTCTASLYAGNYTQGTGIAVNAHIIDGSGLDSWTQTTTIHRNSDTGSTNSAYVYSSSGFSSRLSPNVTTLNAGESTAYIVNAAYTSVASDPNNVKRVDIYANGNIIKTCPTYSQGQTCIADIVANNFSQGTTIALNARIVKISGAEEWIPVTNIYRNTNSDASNTSSNSGTTANTWIWLSSNQTTLASTDSITFNVGAQDNDGLSKIEIIANDNIIKTCWVSGTGNQTCAATIYGNSYSQNTGIFVNAKVTDANGNITWTDSRTLYRGTDTSNSNTSNSTNNGTTNAWTWLDPDVTSMNRGDSTTFNVGAQDSDGLSKIDMMANGNTIKTCWVSGTGNQSCAVTISANGYSAGTSVYLNAKVTDANGNATWTDSHTIAMNAAATSNNTSSNTTTSNTTNPDTVNVWDWIEPTVDALGPNATTAYHIGSWASRGISSVVIYVNGNVAKTCYSSGTGNQDCSVTLNGSSYQTGTSIFVNGVAKSNGGATAWTTGKTISISGTSCSGTACTASNTTGNGTTSGSDVTNGWVSVNSDHESGYTANNAITLAAAAYDPDGVARIDILANGSRVKTCTNAISCSTVVSTNFYDTSFSYAAVMTDKTGNSITTGYKTIYKK